MLFDVQERINLLNILPDTGNAVTLRILRDFQRASSFTEEEMAAIGMVQDDGRVNWDVDKATKKEIEVGDTMKELIVGALNQLNASNRLNMAHLPLYERFVAGGRTPDAVTE
jgi:hypothetical protein